MNKLRKILSTAALILAVSAPLVSVASPNVCSVDGFTRIEQQFVLAAFGQSAAKHFTADDKMAAQVAALSEAQVKSCTNDIPPISGSILSILIAATVTLSLAISGLVIYSALTNAGLGQLFSQASGGSKLPQHALVGLAIVLALPVGFLASKNKDDLMSKYYSPLNHLAFYAGGKATEVASKIDNLFADPSAAVMPTYIIPDPAFLASRESDLDDWGYELNPMSHVLSYAACVVAETDNNQLLNLIDTARVTEGETALSLEIGNTNNGCHFKTTMQRNTYTADQFMAMGDEAVALRYGNLEVEMFRSATLEAVQQAIDYKKAQFDALGRAYSITDRDLKINIDEDWWEACPASLSELVDINTPRTNISELVQADRHAELCLSKNLVSRFYPVDFVYSGQRVPHQPRFESEDLYDAAYEACTVKPEGKQSGMFDCAIAVEVLTHDNHQQHIDELGWAVKPINAMTLLKQTPPPSEPQQSLAQWQFEFSENQTDSSKFSVTNRDIRKRFIEARNNTSAGRTELSELLKEGRPASSAAADLLGIADVRTCLNSPNQLIFNGAGEVVQSCGSPMSTLNDLGGTMIKTYAILQAGHYAKGVMTKMMGKTKGEKKDVDGKLTSKKSSTGALAGLTAVAGAGVMGLLGAGVLSSDVVLPFAYTSDSTLSALGGTAAFVVGAALTDGLLSFSTMLLMGGMALKYGLPMMLILPFYIALIRVLLSVMQMSMQLVIIVVQPLIEQKNVKESYLSLVSRIALLVLSLACLPLFFYLSVITSEVVLPLVLSMVDVLSSNATQGTGSLSAIVFSVVIYTLLYISFVVLMFYKTTDVYKSGWEVSKLIFADSGANHLNENTDQGSTKQATSTAAGLFKK